MKNTYFKIETQVNNKVYYLAILILYNDYKFKINLTDIFNSTNFKTKEEALKIKEQFILENPNHNNQLRIVTFKKESDGDYGFLEIK